MGAIGLSLADFYNCTLGDLSNTIMGFYEFEEKKQNDKLELERSAWERARWSACLFVNTQTTKTVEPRGLGVFSWEESSTETKGTPEQIERMFKGMVEIQK